MITLTATPHALEVHRRINDTSTDFPDATITEIFDDVARTYPSAPAVMDGVRTYSYSDLAVDADRFAARLVECGVDAGSVVAVSMRRSYELVVALVAILRCAATYLPVDRGWPDARLDRMLDQTACHHLFTDSPVEDTRRFPALTVISAPEPGQPQRTPRSTATADSIAYITYTSGSTGIPKGVPTRHRSVLRLVHNAVYADLGPSARILQLSPVTFDAATFEIWGALLTGGACVLYPAPWLRLTELRNTISRHRVSTVFLTTALFNTILDESPAVLDPVATILTGGEAHSIPHITRAVDRWGPDKVVSVYGPTEATTFATYYPVRHRPGEMSSLPIGKPIQNTSAYLVREQRLCEPGELGEIHLGGPGLSPGYIGAPELSRERFVDCRIGDMSERLYRTGDRAYLLDDGNLVFQGRTDDQVKIRGHRIELGEVTHHLMRYSGIRQCFVTVTEGGTGEKSLAAFVTPGGAALDADAVRRHLAHSLPGYMIPSRIVVLDTLPLGPTGKIDRTALLATLTEGVARQ
ncbi:amino acid adenylation domain-containing protein [Nocardia transvalensis]|uniref:amino acid adenylation domain-containing protein n=1 Tax=Nocardia transvalensis TaxID=37333 RepID=UPI001892D9C0|nr:amino acid adenylation domain-containing protein [Nocardia transvalensis]MBF6330030.1 amino acid adenylation domain-containing protein [Nocardia transvalensis]